MPTVSRATALRALLAVACIVAVGVAVAIANPSDRLVADAELAALLRGMAAIKGMIVAAAFALVAWRVGHPIARGAATVCIVAVATMAAATAAIATLSSIVPAAVLFHAALVALAVVGWRDDVVVRTVAGRDRRTAGH